MNWIDEVKFDGAGLMPVIAQELGSGDVLMLAWMNREALQQTAQLRRAVYFSRSRGKLWFKGEQSGHAQSVHQIRLDCDNDVLLLVVTQHGNVPLVSQRQVRSEAAERSDQGTQSGEGGKGAESEVGAENLSDGLAVTGHSEATDQSSSKSTSIACHTGRHSCFFKQLKTRATSSGLQDFFWDVTDPVLKDPTSIYT